MKKGYDSDPAWSRTNTNANTRKKRKMVSRASRRLLISLIKKKRAADKGKVRTICATRTVELPSTHIIGDERNKLLFMVAIGLVPNCDSIDQQRRGPSVCVERLDPAVEAEARARTRDVIHEIFQRRKMESIQARIARHIEPTLSSTSLMSFRAPLPISPPPEDDDNVEIVNLVSSDDECSMDEDDLEVNTSMINGEFHTSVHNRQRRFREESSRCNEPENYRIITSSLYSRKPVFKPLINNQDSGIFRNWKPESFSTLMNFSKSSSTKDIVPVKDSSQLKLLSSLKSIPTASTLTVRKFSSNLSTGGSCKSHVHGAREDSSSTVSKLDFIVPEDLITID